MIKAKHRPERLAFRIERGCLSPADTFSTARLRARGYKIGDLVFAELKKPRSPGFHRLAHKLGSLCAENIADFNGMEAHAVLKRLQWEANIGCEEVGVMVPGVGLAMMRFPRSLSYESMEQGEFRQVIVGFCQFIADKYWKTLTPAQIEHMAECYVEPI